MATVQALRNENEAAYTPSGKGWLPTDGSSLMIATIATVGGALARDYVFDGEPWKDPANAVVAVLCLAGPHLRDQFELATKWRVGTHVIVANCTLLTAAALMPDLKGWFTKAKYAMVVAALYSIADFYYSSAPDIARKK
jgi:hypothetical protein